MKRMLRDLLYCRRGSVAIMFTAIAIPAIGLTAFGAEYGSWHVIRRAAQNAADAAAYAGAIALVNNSGANVQTEGSKFAAQNNFEDGHTTSIGATQTVRITATANAGNTIDVTAVISQKQPTFLASLWLPLGVQITASAVAEIQQNQEKPCALALTGGLTISGNQQFSGGDCVMQSNTNVTFNSDATFNPPGPWFVDSSKGCKGPHCNPANVTANYATAPAVQPAALTGLETICPSQSSCTALNPSGNWPSLTVKKGDPPLLAGTYFYHSLTVNAGGVLAGAGVNIVIGSGGLTINGGGKVDLHAGVNNAISPYLDGVLIYDTEGTAASLSKVNINGDSTSVFGGAMFFPHGDVTWNGNAQGTLANSDICTEVVAGKLTFTGNTNLNITGCKKILGLVGTDQIVFLVH
jgi:Flp pilus assembly protein TadG